MTTTEEPSMSLTPSVVMARMHKRSLRNLLLDRKLQLRYVLVMVAVVGTLTVALGSLVWHFLREASAVVAVRSLDPSDLEAIQLQQVFARNDRWLLVALIGFGVVLTTTLAGYSLVLTHKIAGPLFKIAWHMDRIKNGHLRQVHDLRRGDQLLEFFASFRGMHDALGTAAREEVAELRAVIAELEVAGQKELAERLRLLQRKKQEFIDGRPSI